MGVHPIFSHEKNFWTIMQRIEQIVCVGPFEPRSDPSDDEEPQSEGFQEYPSQTRDTWSLTSFFSRSNRMAATPAQLAVGRPATLCSFDYLSRDERYDKEKPYYFSGPLTEDQEPARSNLTYTTHDGIKVGDIRGLEHRLSLDVHGLNCSNISRESPLRNQANSNYTNTWRRRQLS